MCHTNTNKSLIWVVLDSILLSNVSNWSLVDKKCDWERKSYQRWLGARSFDENQSSTKSMNISYQCYVTKEMCKFIFIN